MRTRLAAAAALGASLVVASGAHAAPTTRFKYVASSLGGNTFLDRWQPVGTAPLGQIRVTPRHKTFTLRVDDRTTPDGQAVAVSLPSGMRCIPVRTTVRLPSITPRREITIKIYGEVDYDWLGLRCSGHASTGTADVGL
jgi:hypothetical protein